MDAMVARPDDVACLGVPFYSFGKAASEVTFYPLQSHPGATTECQVEGMYSWSEETLLKKNLDFEVEDIAKGRPTEFKTKSIKHSPLENNYRIQLVCLKPFANTKFLGCTMRCLAASSPATVFLKRRGCLNDESNRL
jgi:hypothetical protein